MKFFFAAPGLGASNVVKRGYSKNKAGGLLDES